MKKLLSCLAITASLGFGVLAGLAQKHETSEVHADGASGTMTVAMKPGAWDSGDRCKMAVYFFAGSGDNTVSGWSDLVLYKSGVRVADINYNLNFVPEHMIAVRFNHTKAAVGNWDDKWHQTADLDYAANADILVTANDACEVRSSAYIMGMSTQTGGQWQHLTDLTHLQVNYSNNFEYYSEITVTQNEEFKVYNNDVYFDGFDKVTFDSHVDATKWEAGENSNIKYIGTEALTVTLYYDIGNGNIYIADTYEHAIAIRDASFFTNWDEATSSAGGVPGHFKEAGATYGCGSFNAFGSFFDGCSDGCEGRVYTLNSRKWRQYTPYIYFQWGGAKDYKNEGTFAANEEEKLIFNFYANENDSTPAASKVVYNNTFCGLTMLLRNYLIPDDVMSLFNGNDFYMSVDIFDGRGYEYGCHIFGNLHVNQTHEEVSEAQWNYFRNCKGVGSPETWDTYSVQTIRNHYAANATLRSGFVFANGFEEQFDNQASFNNNFMLDAYGNNDGERHEDKAISFASYRGWDNGSKMPFNKTGAGFFKGWYGEAAEDSENRGYVAADSPVYRFVSRPFRLPANGIVSVKMAGTASLHLIDFDGSNGELAFVDCKTFRTDGDEGNIAWTQKNVCTMVRHVINFSKYGGRLVQLAIADVSSGGWGAAYFDELCANYSELPGLKVDIVAQYKDTTSYSAFKDVYVSAVEAGGGVDYKNNDGPESDTSPLKNAAAFVSDYLAQFRNFRDNGNNFCTVVIDDGDNGGEAYVNRFNALSEAEREILCKSDDYHRPGATKDTWTTTEAFRLSLKDSLVLIAAWNNMSISVGGAQNSGRNALVNNQANTAVIIVISIISISTLVLLLAVKKRRVN